MKNNIIEAGHTAQILGGRAVLSNIKDQYLEFWIDSRAALSSARWSTEIM
jgi:hypothetical protein